MGPSSIVRIGTWNTWWATPTSPRGHRIRAALESRKCDVLCVTEGFAGIAPDSGHVIKAPQDWGYPVEDDRRKVLLWSKRPWVDVDFVGSDRLPGGRFLRAGTQTAAGTLVTIVGVCVPWRGAHCNGGRNDRDPWQDHLAWLAEFGRLRSQLPATRLVVLGDFNQRIPRKWAPKAIYEELLQAFAGLKIATEGTLPGAPRQTIDHIAHSPDLTQRGVSVWLDKDAEGRLSDHLGVLGEFILR